MTCTNMGAETERTTELRPIPTGRHARLPRWLTAELVACAWISLGIVPFIGLSREISDPDLFLHLAAGRAGPPMTAERFSFTAAGAHWHNGSWLWQRMIWTMYRAGGLHGLVVFGAALFLLNTIVLLNLVRREASSLPVWAAPFGCALIALAGPPTRTTEGT